MHTKRIEIEKNIMGFDTKILEGICREVLEPYEWEGRQPRQALGAPDGIPRCVELGG